MTLRVVSGKVSHAAQVSETHGQIHGGRGQIRTFHKMKFRIDNRPAVFQGEASIGDGDTVTLAGFDKGEFRALAVRNESTGVEYPGQTILLYVIGALCILLGIPFAFIIVGLPLLGAGAWFIYMGWRNKQALDLLRSSAPAASLSPG
jgi:hypothetical protein